MPRADRRRYCPHGRDLRFPDPAPGVLERSVPRTQGSEGWSASNWRGDRSRQPGIEAEPRLRRSIGPSTGVALNTLPSIDSICGDARRLRVVLRPVQRNRRQDHQPTPINVATITDVSRFPPAFPKADRVRFGREPGRPLAAHCQLPDGASPKRNLSPTRRTCSRLCAKSRFTPAGTGHLGGNGRSAMQCCFGSGVAMSAASVFVALAVCASPGNGRAQPNSSEGVATGVTFAHTGGSWDPARDGTAWIGRGPSVSVWPDPFRGSVPLSVQHGTPFEDPIMVQIRGVDGRRFRELLRSVSAGLRPSRSP